jgi:hypothetical protein
MAVDYLHRLVVTGPDGTVRSLARALHCEYPRTVARRRWKEVVPFSFAALYELAPRAIRVMSEVPFDPYEIAVWPIRRRTKVESEARYQFQTRDLEMVEFIRVLARTQPRLTFTLVTLCFDSSSIESCMFSRNRSRRWIVPERWKVLQWERARRKFRLTDEEMYAHADADRWVEEQSLVEALAHWHPRSARSARARRYQWWNRPRLCDLATERELAWFAAAESMMADEQRARDRRRRGKRRTRSK